MILRHYPITEQPILALSNNKELETQKVKKSGKQAMKNKQGTGSKLQISFLEQR